MFDSIQPEKEDRKPDAVAAYEAYQSMRLAETRNSSLSENPYWQALVDTAYARFYAAWEAE